MASSCLKRSHPARSGEFFGYHQHGMPDLKAADIVKDLPLLEEARKEAQNAMERGMDSGKNSRIDLEGRSLKNGGERSDW